VKCNTSYKILEWEQLAPYIQNLRNNIGSSVALVTGAFDLLHDAHARYIEDASEYGDILIVGVSSDERVRKFKGETRPILPAMIRVRVVAAMEAVDRVFVFDDMDACIEIIRPNAIVASKTTSFDPQMKRFHRAVELGIPVYPVASRSDTHTSDIVKRILSFG
jgi:cytidyltransferase-like protein